MTAQADNDCEPATPFLDDRGEHKWHFFHDPKWNTECPALITGIGPSEGPKGWYFMFWRGKIWELNYSISPRGGPEWVRGIENFPISRTDAKKIFPEVFALDNSETVHSWDSENFDGIITGTYPPSIPDRYRVAPELTELVGRFERGEKLLFLYFNFAERLPAPSEPHVSAATWLERLSPDELADLYFVFKAMQKGYAQSRLSRVPETRLLRELERGLRVIVNWKHRQHSGDSI